MPPVPAEALPLLCALALIAHRLLPRRLRPPGDPATHRLLPPFCRCGMPPPEVILPRAVFFPPPGCGPQGGENPAASLLWHFAERPPSHSLHPRAGLPFIRAASYAPPAILLQSRIRKRRRDRAPQLRKASASTIPQSRLPLLPQFRHSQTTSQSRGCKDNQNHPLNGWFEQAL